MYAFEWQFGSYIKSNIHQCFYINVIAATKAKHNTNHSGWAFETFIYFRQSFWFMYVSDIDLAQKHFRTTS